MIAVHHHKAKSGQRSFSFFELAVHGGWWPHGHLAALRRWVNGSSLRNINLHGSRIQAQDVSCQWLLHRSGRADALASGRLGHMMARHAEVEHGWMPVLRPELAPIDDIDVSEQARGMKVVLSNQVAELFE